MNNLPLVSIVIPVYNGANYLSYAIDSALGQTYQQVEVIVVNDGSTDKGLTRDVAMSYGSRIRYFEKENGKVSSALNLGIREMKGEYFCWLSHDDYYSANRIQTDMDVILESGYEVSYTDIITVDEQGNEMSRSAGPELINSPLMAMANNGLHFCSFTVNKKYVVQNGGFDEKNKTAQDVELTLLVLKDTDIIKNKRSFTYIRMHGQNIHLHTTNNSFQEADLSHTGQVIAKNMDFSGFSRHTPMITRLDKATAALAFADFFYFTRNKSLFYRNLGYVIKYLPFPAFSKSVFVLYLKLVKRFTIDSFKFMFNIY